MSHDQNKQYSTNTQINHDFSHDKSHGHYTFYEKMKLMTPIWSDPIGWSEWIAKTKVRAAVWVLIHLAFILTGLLGILRSANRASSVDLEINFSTILAGLFPIILIGFFYPCLYIIAMYKLLKTIKEEREINYVKDKASPDIHPTKTKVEPVVGDNG